MFNAIYSAIGSFLGWLDKLTGNYVIALFIFAIIVEIVLLPFGIKQQKNSIRQASLRPKEMAIRKKYAGRDDQATKQKVTMEIQELYKRENFNPMGGCLPLLIQFPIIIILYNVVINPMQYMMGFSSDMIKTIGEYITKSVAEGGLGIELASNRGTIAYLSEIADAGLDAFRGIVGFADNGQACFDQLTAAFEKGLPNFNFFGLNLSQTPSIKEFGWLWLIPILTFVVYFFSMRLTRKFTYQPTTADDPQVGCSNTVMDFTMPLMSVWFTFMLPAAIGVYWIFKSILGTVKQIALQKFMPVPRFTDEDYKAAERELAGKKPKAGTAQNATMAPVRSLHHIDDEDFEDTRAQAEARKKLIAEAEQKSKEAKENAARKVAMKETSQEARQKDESGEKKDASDTSDTSDSGKN